MISCNVFKQLTCLRFTYLLKHDLEAQKARRRGAKNPESYPPKQNNNNNNNNNNNHYYYCRKMNNMNEYNTYHRRHLKAQSSQGLRAKLPGSWPMFQIDRLKTDRTR